MPPAALSSPTRRVFSGPRRPGQPRWPARAGTGARPRGTRTDCSSVTSSPYEEARFCQVLKVAFGTQRLLEHGPAVPSRQLTQRRGQRQQRQRVGQRQAFAPHRHHPRGRGPGHRLPGKPGLPTAGPRHPSTGPAQGPATRAPQPAHPTTPAPAGSPPHAQFESARRRPTPLPRPQTADWGSPTLPIRFTQMARPGWPDRRWQTGGHDRRIPRRTFTATCRRPARPCSGSSTGCPSTTSAGRWCRPAPTCSGWSSTWPAWSSGTSASLRPALRRAAALAGRGRRAQRGHVGDPRRVARGHRRAVPPGVGALRRHDRGPALDAIGHVPWWPDGRARSRCTGSWCT